MAMQINSYTGQELYRSRAIQVKSYTGQELYRSRDIQNESYTGQGLYRSRAIQIKGYIDQGLYRSRAIQAKEDPKREEERIESIRAGGTPYNIIFTLRTFVLGPTCVGHSACAES